jgi:hypothetical protein
MRFIGELLKGGGSARRRGGSGTRGVGRAMQNLSIVAESLGPAKGVRPHR